MKQLIARLRELEAAALVGDPDLLGETIASMEFINLLVDSSAQLLDRLEKLEAVVEAARYVVPGMIEDYGPDQSDMACLRTALAALEGDK